MGIFDWVPDALYSSGEERSTESELPRDVLFVDQSRIDLLFEQISNPVIYDEVVDSSIRSSLTNLGVNKRIRKSKREPTTEEKISELIDSIGEADDESTRFRISACYAKRGHVPSPDDNRFDDLWVWGSHPPQNPSDDSLSPISQEISEDLLEVVHDSPNQLILIENTQNPSDSPTRFTGVSTLRALLSAREPILDGDESKLDGLEGTSLDMTREIRGPPSEIGEEKDLDSMSAFEMFSALDAEFGREREILTVYTEELMYADENAGFSDTVFGYPIIIWSVE